MTSKAEAALYEECLRRFSKVERWKFLKITGNHTCIDIYLPDQDAYIEMDGVYWHGLDRPYAQLEPRVKAKYDRDRALDVACALKGVRLFRITDKQVQVKDWEWLFDRV